MTLNTLYIIILVLFICVICNMQCKNTASLIYYLIMSKHNDYSIIFHVVTLQNRFSAFSFRVSWRFEFYKLSGDMYNETICTVRPKLVVTLNLVSHSTGLSKKDDTAQLLKARECSALFLIYRKVTNAS